MLNNCCNKKGFSTIEVIIGLGILAIAMVIIANVMNLIYRHQPQTDNKLMVTYEVENALTFIRNKTNFIRNTASVSSINVSYLAFRGEFTGHPGFLIMSGGNALPTENSFYDGTDVMVPLDYNTGYDGEEFYVTHNRLMYKYTPRPAGMFMPMPVAQQQIVMEGVATFSVRALAGYWAQRNMTAANYLRDVTNNLNIVTTTGNMYQVGALQIRVGKYDNEGNLVMMDLFVDVPGNNFALPGSVQIGGNLPARKMAFNQARMDNNTPIIDYNTSKYFDVLGPHWTAYNFPNGMGIPTSTQNMAVFYGTVGQARYTRQWYHPNISLTANALSNKGDWLYVGTSFKFNSDYPLNNKSRCSINLYDSDGTNTFEWIEYSIADIGQWVSYNFVASSTANQNDIKSNYNVFAAQTPVAPITGKTDNKWHNLGILITEDKFSVFYDLNPIPLFQGHHNGRAYDLASWRVMFRLLTELPPVVQPVFKVRDLVISNLPIYNVTYNASTLTVMSITHNIKAAWCSPNYIYGMYESGSLMIGASLNANEEYKYFPPALTKVNMSTTGSWNMELYRRVLISNCNGYDGNRINSDWKRVYCCSWPDPSTWAWTFNGWNEDNIVKRLDPIQIPFISDWLRFRMEFIASKSVLAGPTTTVNNVVLSW